MKDSKFQYPPQIGTYSVKVKSGASWKAYKHARFQISVGQEYHESEKFKATMEWAKHRFDKVIICVNDTLQRYNFICNEGLQDLEAHTKAEAQGREWVERNISTIRSLPNYEIHRWDDWRNHLEFQKEYAYVTNLYEHEALVKDLVMQDVLTFWNRRTQKRGNHTGVSFSEFKNASTNYLIEETAAFFLMFKKDHAVDIYPGSTLLPCVLAHKYCFNSDSSPLGEKAFTRIDFARKIAQAA